MTVTATDTTGLTDSASFSLRINSEPVIDAAASISQYRRGHRNDSDLQCDHHRRRRWEPHTKLRLVDWWGFVATGATFTLSSSNSNVGDVILCTATATDSDRKWQPQCKCSGRKTPPTVVGVGITPTTVYNDTVLTCTGQQLTQMKPSLHPLSGLWRVSLSVQEAASIWRPPQRCLAMWLTVCVDE